MALDRVTSPTDPAEAREPGALGRRGFAVLTLLMLSALVVLTSLGQWQVRRLAWKEALVEAVGERPNLPVLQPPPEAAWNDLDLDPIVYRRMRLRGRYEARGQVRVFTALSEPNGRYGGPGFWIMTPLRLSTDGIVYVNRGFVPQERGEESWAPPADAVTVEGLVRPADAGNAFTPAADEERRIAYVRDPLALSLLAGIDGRVAPFTVDLRKDHMPASGLPQAGETAMRFANNHLQYAITWYGLALTLLGVYAAVVWSRLTAPKRGS